MKRIIALFLYISAAACGNAPDDPGPGGVSNADAKALDEAAAKLDRVDEEEYRKKVDPPELPEARAD